MTYLRATNGKISVSKEKNLYEWLSALKTPLGSTRKIFLDRLECLGHIKGLQ